MNRLAVMFASGLLLAGCESDEKYDKLPLEQTPPAVKTGVEKNFPGATIKEVEKETYQNGTIHYEVELVTKDGSKKEVEFAPDGELLDKH